MQIAALNSVINRQSSKLIAIASENIAYLIKYEVKILKTKAPKGLNYLWVI